MLGDCSLHVVDVVGWLEDHLKAMLCCVRSQLDLRRIAAEENPGRRILAQLRLNCRVKLRPVHDRHVHVAQHHSCFVVRIEQPDQCILRIVESDNFDTISIDTNGAQYTPIGAKQPPFIIDVQNRRLPFALFLISLRHCGLLGKRKSAREPPSRRANLKQVVRFYRRQSHRLVEADDPRPLAPPRLRHCHQLDIIRDQRHIASSLQNSEGLLGITHVHDDMGRTCDSRHVSPPC